MTKSDRGKAPCKYDWIPGYEGDRLHCVVHEHGGNGTVFRTRWTDEDYDTLVEMLRLDVLTGQALAASFSAASVSFGSTASRYLTRRHADLNFSAPASRK
jgi:hypothetical protein